MRAPLHREAEGQPEHRVRRAGREPLRGAARKLEIREVDDKIWLVSFLDYDLGYFDEVEGRIEPGPDPFNPEL